ncbi:MAG: hypothetical protein QM754_00190 [Tepidisphaeraceae bacterium]
MVASLCAAQGLMLCIHANGTTRIENLSQQMACSEEREQHRAEHSSDDELPASADDSGGSGEGCVDVPVTGPDAAVRVSAAASHGIVLHFLAVIPQFLSPSLIARPGESAVHSVIADERLRPCAVLDSLNSVVLVI